MGSRNMCAKTLIILLVKGDGWVKTQQRKPALRVLP